MSIWHEVEQALGRDPLMVARVVEVNANGTSIVQFPNASRLVVRGDSIAVDGYAFVRVGEIVGAAPATVPVVLEV